MSYNAVWRICVFPLYLLRLNAVLIPYLKKKREKALSSQRWQRVINGQHSSYHHLYSSGNQWRWPVASVLGLNSPHEPAAARGSAACVIAAIVRATRRQLRSEREWWVEKRRRRSGKSCPHVARCRHWLMAIILSLSPASEKDWSFPLHQFDWRHKAVGESPSRLF